METPEKSLLNLQEAVTEEAWLKMKKKEELEAEYEKRIKQLEVMEAEAKSLADANLEEVYRTQLADFTVGPKKVSEEQLSSIVDTLLQAHMEDSMVAVSKSLFRQNVDLNFRLEQLELLPVVQAQQKEINVVSLHNSSRSPSRTSQGGLKSMNLL